MNNKISNLLKTYLEPLSWTEKLSGIVQTVSVKEGLKDAPVDKTYPVSVNITAEQGTKGAYLDLAPNSKKKSVLYFEDKGVSYVERLGSRLKFQSSLRLVCWLNLGMIGDVPGVSGDYVIAVIKALPTTPIQTADFVSIFISGISQVERDVSIFSKYTYNEQALQYLMYPYDYFALDLTIDFVIPC